MMVFGGKYSHTILKRAKQGEFKVQDDFGGTVHDYISTQDEINFAEACVAACKEQPVYARVDCMWDEDGALCLSELEMIEPELWFRNDEKSPKRMAEAIMTYIKNQ